MYCKIIRLIFYSRFLKAEIFHGEVIGLRDVITFQGKTAERSKGEVFNADAVVIKPVMNAIEK